MERVPVGDGVLHVLVRKEEPAREGGGARLTFVRRLAADSASVALFVEALDAETLALLGRAIMRRLSG